MANEYIFKANEYKEILKQECEGIGSDFVLINEFIKHAKRQIGQIERRVFKNEVIPHKWKRYIALAVVARNIQVLGTIVQ